MIKVEKEDSGEKGRFVIYENDELAGEMTYTWEGKTKLIINHTGVKERFGGKGFGKQLVMKAVDFARKNKVRILPLCPFAKKVFDANKELQDVIV